MKGDQRVPASPVGRCDAPTLIRAGCTQILLPGKGKRPPIAALRRASGECWLNFAYKPELRNESPKAQNLWRTEYRNERARRIDKKKYW